ncbi:glycoside hydrolase family 43 protein [Pedobacter sandarakinus]|uniref:glycoside hydrolase family 43 protein n=1 Tax=Pedobacter sandarakinus TaxID=353156 RepID=UPI00224578D3|nr:glycoside hydrolase family 43 protein [Pedobacter sandarakinus]MCX2575164.1 glycoside hydrolase family 43 protein [Pedobacter sandarakinus]
MIKQRKSKLCSIAVCSLFAVAILSCGKSDNPVPVEPLPPPTSTVGTFANPLMNGADPSVFQKDGVYYYLQTNGTSIALYTTTAMSKLSSAVPKTVFTPTAGSANSRNVWAPEMFFLDGKWYIYYTAGNGSDISQRTWVIENSSADPTLGTWVEKGRIFAANADFWAIDGTVFEQNGTRYFLWCGRPDLTNTNLTQNIYIAKMANAYTIEGNATLLTAPELAWEKNGFGVNEGPEVLTNNDKSFLIYSASYCGTDDYALGMLALKPGGNPLTKADWVKSDQPLFSKKPQSNAFGPGHNSFFKSPDGKENWLIYHANAATNQGCADRRNIRMQKFSFKADGSPDFGEPVATGLQINKPSGEQ